MLSKDVLTPGMSIYKRVEIMKKDRQPSTAAIEHIDRQSTTATPDAQSHATPTDQLLFANMSIARQTTDFDVTSRNVPVSGPRHWDTGIHAAFEESRP